MPHSPPPQHFPPTCKNVLFPEFSQTPHQNQNPVNIMCLQIQNLKNQLSLSTRVSTNRSSPFINYIQKSTILMMDRLQRSKPRANLEKLRKKIQIDFRSALPLLSSRLDKSERFSENSLFSFEEYYRLGDKIGEGAHAVVKKVQEIETGQVFAAKIMKVDEEKIQTIKQNFLMCRVIKHPSIIQHHQLFINRRKQQVFLVMEYCPFPSLQAVYKTVHSHSEVAHIMKSLLEAVCELHKNGICHRDLKLANILYEKETGKIKIIDMGISKLIFNRKTGQKEKMWSVTGTMHYKAPEMFEGVEYDEKIDAWALGVIAYQLAYGKLPFNSEFQHTLITQIIRGEPIFQDSVNPEENLLLHFIQGLLKKDPKKRMNCFEAIHHPFIQHSELHTKMFRYENLFHLDKFSSKISRSRSLDGVLTEKANAGLQKVETIKELKQNIISDSEKSL